MNIPVSFSVVIPNYNNAGTLARAIDSVLTQTYPALEVIVIDDGSKDNSADVARSFGDRVQYVRQENAGVSAARNKGARLAKGDWLAFLDADDLYLPERLETHARWIDREPEIDFLFGDQEYREPDGKLLQYAINASESGRRLVAKHPAEIEIPITQDDFELFVADGFAEIRTLSLPRATFWNLGGFPLEHKIGEDVFFFIRLCAASRKGGVINKPLAIYYIYAGSALRKDPILAQTRYVAALDALTNEMRMTQAGVRRGWREKLRQGRLSLAYMYLRKGEKRTALSVVAPLLLRNPSFSSLRDIVSIMRGMS